MKNKLPPHLQEKLAENIEKKCEEHFISRLTGVNDIPISLALQTGYDVGAKESADLIYSLIMQELGPVVEALEFYGEHEHWKTIEHCESESKIRIDAKDFDAEIYEGQLVFHAGKISREALKHLKERVLNEERTGG